MTGYEFKDDSPDVECPTCGRTDFKSGTGMKLHHAKAHGESIAGVEVICDQCGEIYREPQCSAERSRFCSNECQAEWRSESGHFVGETNPRQYASSTVEVECAWCGHEKTVYRSRFEENERHFCDQRCQGDWYSENRIGEDTPNWNGGRVELTCGSCDGTYLEKRHRTERSKCCSKECLREWRSENYSGENAPRWKGGYVGYYGPNWYTQREKARERDGYECRICGMGDEDHTEEYGKELPVHHIDPFRTFKPFESVEDYERANSLDNLITLCDPHHHEVEQITPLLPDGIRPAGGD